MKKRKMSQAWKNRIWNGSILAAFVAAMAVFVFLLQTEKIFQPGGMTNC